MGEKEIMEALSELFKDGGSWWQYPAHWDYDKECYDLKSIALDGSFTLETLEKIVSYLRRAEVRGEKR